MNRRKRQQIARHMEASRFTVDSVTRMVKDAGGKVIMAPSGGHFLVKGAFPSRWNTTKCTLGIFKMCDDGRCIPQKLFRAGLEFDGGTMQLVKNELLHLDHDEIGLAMNGTVRGDLLGIPRLSIHRISKRIINGMSRFADTLRLSVTACRIGSLHETYGINRRTWHILRMAYASPGLAAVKIAELQRKAELLRETT